MYCMIFCLEKEVRSCLDRTFQLKQEIFFAFQYLDLSSRYQVFPKFLKGKKFFKKRKKNRKKTKTEIDLIDFQDNDLCSSVDSSSFCRFYIFHTETT